MTTSRLRISSLFLASIVATIALFADDPPPPKVDLQVVKTTSNFGVRSSVEDALVLSAKLPLARDIVTKVTVIKGDALLRSPDAPNALASEVTVTLKKEVGKASVAMLTANDAEIILRVTSDAADKPIPDQVLSSQLRIDTLGSRRSTYELFVGQTFTNNYDEKGKATGFGDAGQLVRLSFNTMFPHQGKTPNKHGFRRGAWHTDLDAEFAKFPFGPADPPETPATASTALRPRPLDDDTTDNAKGLENAFTGHLGLTWEPNAWARYERRGEQELKGSDNLEFDVTRWGLFGKAGVTTRAEAAKYSKNNTIDRIQYGVRFSQGHSAQSGPEVEDTNYVPIRFVEISFVRFSEWAGEARNRNRVLIDGGLRLSALSNNVIPFYAGIHLNTGPGPDDLRVFVGFLFKLDKLAGLVHLTAQGD